MQGTAGGGGPDESPAERRRLEIVHESLLTKWPRLVRWRAQDEEGAVLRDQLRHAAQVWERRGRGEDFLWTGTAFREFQLWRERYPGGLTTLEEAFAGASAALAQRRRRRRRLAIGIVIAALATGLVVVTGLRQQAVRQTRRAEAEARRAEASKLLALGQVELEGNPTAALAYAIRSLELDDSHAARIFVLKALAAGPIAFLHPMRLQETGPAERVVFSPDGAWMAVRGKERLHVVSRDRGSPLVLEPFPSGTGWVSAAFDPEVEHLYAAKDGLVRVLSVPAFDLLETQNLGGSYTGLRSTPAGVLATTRVSDEPREVEIAALAPDAPPRRIGRIEDAEIWDLDSAGTTLAFARDGALYVRSLDHPGEPPRQVGIYEGRPRFVLHPAGDRLAAYDEASGEIRLWAVERGARQPIRSLEARFEPLNQFMFDPAGGRLAALGSVAEELRVALWALDAPVTAAAMSFPSPFGGFLFDAAYSPDGRWLAAANFHAVCLWPVARSEPRILRGHRVGVTDVRFTPDGNRLVSVDRAGEVREWVLRRGGASRTLARVNRWSVLDVDRQGRFLAVAQKGGALLVPLNGGEPRTLEGFAPTTNLQSVAIDRDGRRVATASADGPRDDKVIRVWDLETGEVRVLGPTEQAGDGLAGQTYGLGFLADGSLASAGEGWLRIWSLPSGAHEDVAPSFVQSHLTVFPDGHKVAYIVGTDQTRLYESVSVAITDLATRETRILRSHGGKVLDAAVDPAGAVVVSGGADGIVRVGPVDGGEPHLLMGHEGWVWAVDVSPDGRWIASAGDDRTVRVWPMPDVSRPPPHTLPLDQLLGRLRSLTNLRVVPASESRISSWLRTGRGSGYELALEPFPGWAVVPEW